MAAKSGEYRGEGRVYLAFAVLAVLAGPGIGYASGAILVATQLQVFAGLAMAELLAGGLLVGYAAASRQRRPAAMQWGAMLALLVPQWCAVALTSSAGLFSWLHGIGWGTVLLLGLAAPLWLGLVAAFDLVEVEVPRSVVAAAMVGMGGVCLVVPTNAYRVAWNQVPMLLLLSLTSIATVVSWAIARPRLRALSAEWAAGGYLLLSCLGDAFFALLWERSSWSWQAIIARALLVPLLCDAVTLAATWWLWFRLLERMTLAAFGMRQLAAWVAAVVPELALIGFRQWRLDAALVIALGAIVVALRARGGEEQPVALGLGTP
jgi:hypothetical protein